MLARCSVVALLALTACTFDNSGVPEMGNSNVPADAAKQDDSRSTLPDGTAGECGGASDGTKCLGGICLGGSCRSDVPTELPASALTVFETDSTTLSADNSLDGNLDSRWTSWPDALPRYITYQLDQSYYIAGVRVDPNLWSHCGQSDLSVSSDAVSWTPVASYTQSTTLPANADAMFATPTAGQYIRININARTDGSTYCYIAEFRVIVVGQ